MAACFEQGHGLLLPVLVLYKHVAFSFGQEVKMHVVLIVIPLVDKAFLRLAEVAFQFVDHSLEHVFGVYVFK